MKKLMGAFLVLCLLAVPTAGFAASPWTEVDNYSDKAIAKLEFGVKNLFVGWVDLFQEPYNAQQEDGAEWYSGIGKGLADTVTNTLGGAIHAATFLIPVDVPLPDNGVQLD